MSETQNKPLLSPGSGNQAPPQLQMLWPAHRLASPPEPRLSVGYELRTYQPEDKAGYLGLMAEAGFSSFDENSLQNWLEKVLPDGFFVIEHHDSRQIVATSMATHHPDPLHPFGGELGWVAGSRAHAGRGLGRAVCSAVTARFIQAGYQRIYLRTDDFRLPALKIYLQLGFVPFLFTPEMESRWEKICANLNWPFTPQEWPKYVAPQASHHPAPGKKPIRVGVIGVGRGIAFAQSASAAVGMQLVALCDTWEEKLIEAGRKFDVATYTDYDRFLEHDMDAVILANYFHQHAPFAIKALQAGKHVMSETACNTTLAEGVALCRAVESSGKIYMLAENYAYTAFTQEMRRLYRSGEIGEALYAEGEYNHPMALDDILRIAPGQKHWRSWIPSTYYCTHALAPLMYMTSTMPVKINALSIASQEFQAKGYRRGDPGSVILCRMDNGAIFRIFGLVLPGHSNWYRVHGTRGAMEITRGPGYFGPGQVRVWHEEWNRKPEWPTERSYIPDWPEYKELADQAGHGGGDFWTNFHFAQAIQSGQRPFLDVYRGVTMSSVGILAWKSALQDGAPLAMPDFSNEAFVPWYENDHWSPWPEQSGPGQPPPSILGFHEPSEQATVHAREVWKEIGYTGE